MKVSLTSSLHTAGRIKSYRKHKKITWFSCSIPFHTCFTFIDGDRENQWLQMCPFSLKIESLCVVAEQKQYMALINLAIQPVFVPIADRKDKCCAMQALLLPLLSRWNLLLFVHLNKRRFAEKKQVKLHETWWRDGIKGIKVWLFRKISTFF